MRHSVLSRVLVTQTLPAPTAIAPGRHPRDLVRRGMGVGRVDPEDQFAGAVDNPDCALAERDGLHTVADGDPVLDLCLMRTELDDRADIAGRLPKAGRHPHGVGADVTPVGVPPTAGVAPTSPVAASMREMVASRKLRTQTACAPNAIHVGCNPTWTARSKVSPPGGICPTVLGPGTSGAAHRPGSRVTAAAVPKNARTAQNAEGPSARHEAAETAGFFVSCGRGRGRGIHGSRALDHGEEPPLAGDSLERRGTSVGELDARAGYKLPDGRGDHDLAGLGTSQHPGRGVDGDAVAACPPPCSTSPDVDAGADLDATSCRSDWMMSRAHEDRPGPACQRSRRIRRRPYRISRPRCCLSWARTAR